MLLTRPPLSPKGPLDLHVLGTPPAFVLSQDQTLHFSLLHVDFDPMELKLSILVSYLI